MKQPKITRRNYPQYALEVVQRNRAAGIEGQSLSMAITTMIGIESAGESGYNEWTTEALGVLFTTIAKIAPNSGHWREIAVGVASELRFIADYEREQCEASVGETELAELLDKTESDPKLHRKLLDVRKSLVAQRMAS